MIGALLLRNSAVHKVDLKQADFGDAKAGQAYAAIVEILENEDAADPLTVETKTGGRVSAEWCIEALAMVPTAENVEYYAAIVADEHLRRRVRMIGHELTRDPSRQLSGADLLTIAQDGIDEIGRADASKGWDPPIPFHHVDIPRFPLDILPTWAANFVRAVAEFSQTPVDLAGMLALAAMSAAARGACDIEAPPGHQEPLCLYLTVVLPPGERKSSVFQAMVSPVAAFEADEGQRLAPQIAEEQAQRDILTKRGESLRTRAAKTEDPPERAKLTHDAMDIAAELAELPPIPSARLLADDSTPEALVGLLAANGGNIAILSAEGGIFNIIAGLYGDGKSNLDGILKAHDAEPIQIDRRGRPSEHIPRPVLTIGLAVQPAVIEGVMANKRFRGRGFTARFLYSVPVSLVGCRRVAVDPPAAALRKEYSEGLRAMLEAAP